MVKSLASGLKNMTTKKHNNNGKDQEKYVESNEQVTESSTISIDEFEALQNQLVESQAKAAEYLDGWQRSQAEFANYKRRTDQEKAAFYQSAKGDVMKRYLPVLDDLDRAMVNRPTDLNESWANGIDLIYRKLQGILEAEGITRIEAEGQMFDPNLHEAISQEPSDSHETGQVIAVVQQGYILGDRVLRHALVRVAA
jgi:molecular chaperone GrpE